MFPFQEVYLGQRNIQVQIKSQWSVVCHVVLWTFMFTQNPDSKPVSSVSHVLGEFCLSAFSAIENLYKLLRFKTKQS